MRRVLLSMLLAAGLLAQTRAQETQPAQTQPAGKESAAAVKESAPSGPAMEQPKPGELHKKLDFMLGQWEGAEKYPAGEMGAGGEGKSTSTNQWILGGLVLATEYKGQGAMGPYDGHGLFKVDPTGKGYEFYWFDSWNQVDILKGAWKDDKTLVFEGEHPAGMMGPTAVKTRLTWVKTSDTETKFTYEMDHGQGFKPMIETISKKKS